MEKETFIKHYLKPSVDELDKRFALPLPDIADLKKSGEFIVQGTLDQTVSTNIISKYVSDTKGIRLVEVYKNTEETLKGIFIRLVGTMSLLKKGYPFLFLDAAVTNVSFQTGQQEELTTRVAIHLPQSDRTKRTIFFDALSQKADRAGLTHHTREIESMPDFWGPLWSVQSEGIAFDVIKTLREVAWTSYERYCSQTEDKPDFDYRPVQHQMILMTSQAEHRFFKKVGLSVAVEAQAGFFSVLVADA